MEFVYFFHFTLAEAMGEKLEVELDKVIFNLSTFVLKSSDSPISPVLHSLLGRQPLLLPPFLSLKFAESMCPGFCWGRIFPNDRNNHMSGSNGNMVVQFLDLYFFALLWCIDQT